MTDITPIINAVIVLIAAVITVFVVPYIKTRTTESQQAIIAFVVQTAVSAAEQLIQGEDLGAKRFGMVIDRVQDELERRGIKFNYEEVRLQIEDAVRCMNMEKEKDNAG